MITGIATQAGFTFLIALFALGALGSLIFRTHDRLVTLWSSAFSVAGAVWGLMFAYGVMSLGGGISFALAPSHFPLLSFQIHVDMLSAFFVGVISLITLFASLYGVEYVKHYYTKYSIGSLGFFYNLFILGMLLVVSSANALFFLVAWEIMSLASYFLVVYDHKNESNVKAGFLYLVMTQVGTVFITSAFLVLFAYTGSFDFDVMRLGAGALPSFIKDLVFIAALIGFGTKAGIVPLHIWLPSAHPAAPSHISALMSGVMIKTGIYMMIRMFVDILAPAPLSWGLIILTLGAISSLLGVLYALTEHDLKRLLAYHSIENIGIILLGLGSSITFLALGVPSLALLGFVASLFHVVNHAIFKSLLFMGAGAVIAQTHTRNMEEHGGLIRYMPYTAVFFLIGSMAISALPPFNGFWSEWLTFHSLLPGIALLDFSGKAVFIFAAGSLAFTGGLALACFVKAFGAVFLARPRSAEVGHAKEVGYPMLLGMGSLAGLSLIFGLFSGPISLALGRIAGDMRMFEGAVSLLSVSEAKGLSVAGGFSSASAPLFTIFFGVVILCVAGITAFVINRKQKVVIGDTWDCGTDLTPRMEITSTGFARSIVMIFQGLLRPTVQHDIEYHDAESRYMPKSRTVTLGIRDIHRSYFYGPLEKMIRSVSLKVKRIQSGVVNMYVLYILIALVVAFYSVV